MADTGPTTLSLFSGTGGLDLGWQLATGGRVVGYAERDAYAAAVLLARMEDSSLEPAPVWCGDICKLPLAPFHGVDAIIGGFPCQDISQAGSRAGIGGERSGLWGRAFVPAIRDLRPRYVFVENVAALVTRGLGDVLGDLASLGYDTEWLSLRASDVGAPHCRERVFVLAHARRAGDEQRRGGRGADARAPGEGEGDEQRGQRIWADAGHGGGTVADDDEHGREGERGGWIRHGERAALGDDADRRGADVEHAPGQRASTGEFARQLCGAKHADADVGNATGERRAQGRPEPARDQRRPDAVEPDGAMGDTHGEGLEGGGCSGQGGRIFSPGPGEQDAWAAVLAERPWLAPAAKRDFCDLADGLAPLVDGSRADALRCAGNGVVPLQAALAAQLLLRRLSDA